MRYPGGKTWLIPHLRVFFEKVRPSLLMEPFCGGGTASLTAVSEGKGMTAVMMDLDPHLAAFWQAVLERGEELIGLIADFQPTDEILAEWDRHGPACGLELGFRTLVRNRTRRSGILAPGAGSIRKGDGGRGLTARWYPNTLIKRIRNIQAVSERLRFRNVDAMSCLPSLLEAHKTEQVALFVDPPYTAGGKQGQRLYSHYELDHACLFGLLADCEQPFVMTYDASPRVLELVCEHGFHAVRVKVKNAQHAYKSEVVITRDRFFV